MAHTRPRSEKVTIPTKQLVMRLQTRTGRLIQSHLIQSNPRKYLIMAETATELQIKGT